MSTQTKRDHLASRTGNCANVHNVVATFMVGHSLDLIPYAIAMHGRAAPANFPAVVSRSTDTATANSVFGTGRTVMVGCKSEMHALLGAQMIAKLIYEQLGICGSVINFKIVNSGKINMCTRRLARTEVVSKKRILLNLCVCMIISVPRGSSVSIITMYSGANCAFEGAFFHVTLHCVVSSH